MRLSGDRCGGAGLAALGAGLLWWAAGIDQGPGLVGLSPRTLPIGLGLVVLSVGLALAVRGGGAPLEEIAQRLSARVAAFAGLLLAYFLLFPSLDFRLGAWAFMLAAMALLGARRPLELLVVPPAVALGIYLVFRHGFGVFLPVWG